MVVREKHQSELYRTSKSLAVPIVDIFHGFIESFQACFRDKRLNRERNLDNSSPRPFAEYAYKQGSGSPLAMLSLPPSLDFLSPHNLNFNLFRLTLTVNQFGDPHQQHCLSPLILVYFELNGSRWTWSLKYFSIETQTLAEDDTPIPFRRG